MTTCARGHDEDVTLEHRPAVEERDDVGFLEHERGRRFARDDPAERAIGRRHAARRARYGAIGWLFACRYGRRPRSYAIGAVTNRPMPQSDHTEHADEDRQRAARGRPPDVVRHHVEARAERVTQAHALIEEVERREAQRSRR